MGLRQTYNSVSCSNASSNSTLHPTVPSLLTSILQLPINMFDGAKIWNNILFYNFDFLEPVWFLEDKYLR